eukprot:15471649-Alexandrium_andersonii.AAC.1
MVISPTSDKKIGLSSAPACKEDTGRCPAFSCGVHRDTRGPFWLVRFGCAHARVGPYLGCVSVAQLPASEGRARSNPQAPALRA